MANANKVAQFKYFPEKLNTKSLPHIYDFSELNK